MKPRLKVNRIQPISQTDRAQLKKGGESMNRDQEHTQIRNEQGKY